MQLEYREKISSIKKYASVNKVSTEQVNELFKECFCLLDSVNKTSTKMTTTFKLLKFLTIIFCLITSSIIILYAHPQTNKVLLRNVQNFIYPGLKIFRKIAVPVISTYPSLTELYDESCILENPYFRVNEMDCWPCSNVNAVKNFTSYYKTASTLNSGIPFTRVERYKNFNASQLFKFYIEHNIDTAKDAFFNLALCKNNRDVISNNGLYDENWIQNDHTTWRINRMESGRRLRKLFPKLAGVPYWWSPSVEKFVFIDKPKAMGYSLPNPECANVIIQCVSGERTIQLLPSPECARNCEKLNISLSASHSLWYNWWYWRPLSLPSNETTDVTIMYLTSYC